MTSDIRSESEGTTAAARRSPPAPSYRSTPARPPRETPEDDALRSTPGHQALVDRGGRRLGPGGIAHAADGAGVANQPGRQILETDRDVLPGRSRPAAPSSWS